MNLHLVLKNSWSQSSWRWSPQLVYLPKHKMTNCVYITDSELNLAWQQLMSDFNAAARMHKQQRHSPIHPTDNFNEQDPIIQTGVYIIPEIQLTK